MHASHKWVRAALLGGVAFGVMATGAQASDDLSGLKAQLEALQARVNQIEARPSTAQAPALPKGASFISIRRGSNMPGFNDDRLAEPSTQIPTDRGYTIAITPAADMPAPIMEVTVSGYVKADFIYDTHQDLGDFATVSNMTPGADSRRAHVRFHARESRFRIKSRSDTAVGQIRTLIEGDFYGDNAGGDANNQGSFGDFLTTNQVVSNSTPFRLRHAWGEWDISPHTTLGFGQFWSLWFPIGTSVPKLDFTSPAGAHFQRAGQFRITHRQGPWTFAFTAQNPETDIRLQETGGGLLGAAESINAFAEGTTDKAPDLLAEIKYAAGGHLFAVRGLVRFLSVDPDVPGASFLITDEESEVGFGIQASVKIAVAHGIAIMANGIWGDGHGRYQLDNGLNAAILTLAGDLETIEAYGFDVGISAKLSPTTTFNALYGYFYLTDDMPGTSNGVPSIIKEHQSVHVNIMWQPASKFRLGLEGIWRDREFNLAGTDDQQNFRLQFAAQFFF